MFSKTHKNQPSARIYDLTTALTANTVVYPGDPRFSYEEVVSLENGASFHLCQIQLGNHTGTHIDFPAHVIPGGKTSSDFSIEALIGDGLIIDVPETEHSITKAFVNAQEAICPKDFVFFRTANSKRSKQAEFTEQYVYIEPDAAEALIQKGVKIVGIDYISVDAYQADTLPVHHALLAKDILIVENLELSAAPLARCKLYIMPIHIPDMDGLPVRVIAQSS